MESIVRIFFPIKSYERLRDMLVSHKISVEDSIFEQIQNVCQQGIEVLDTKTFTLSVSMDGVITQKKIELPNLEEYHLNFDSKWTPDYAKDSNKWRMVSCNVGSQAVKFLEAYGAAVNYLNNSEVHNFKKSLHDHIQTAKKEKKTDAQIETIKNGFEELIKTHSKNIECLDVILQDAIWPEINKKIMSHMRNIINKEFQELKNKN